MAGDSKRIVPLVIGDYEDDVGSATRSGPRFEWGEGVRASRKHQIPTPHAGNRKASPWFHSKTIRHSGKRGRGIGVDRLARLAPD
jgi:hypothetical protein